MKVHTNFLVIPTCLQRFKPLFWSYRYWQGSDSIPCIHHVVLCGIIVDIRPLSAAEEAMSAITWQSENSNWTSVLRYNNRTHVHVNTVSPNMIGEGKLWLSSLPCVRPSLITTMRHSPCASLCFKTKTQAPSTSYILEHFSLVLAKTDFVKKRCFVRLYTQQ